MRIYVKLMEDFFGILDDEHPEALGPPSIIIWLEQECGTADLFLIVGVGDAAAGTAALLVNGESKHVVIGVVHDPGAIREVGVVVPCRVSRGEVGGDQDSLERLLGIHGHRDDVTQVPHLKGEGAKSSPVYIMSNRSSSQKSIEHSVQTKVKFCPSAFSRSFTIKNVHSSAKAEALAEGKTSAD